MKKTFSYNQKKLFLAVGLFAGGYLLSFAASKAPALSEKYYSMGIYRGLKEIFGRISGILPFSLAEVLIVLLVFFVVFIIINFTVNILKNKGKRKELIIKYAAQFLVCIGVIYLSFIVFCGLNYSRLPYADLAGFKIEQSSQEDLAKLATWLIAETNQMRTQATTNDSTVINPCESYYQLGRSAADIFTDFGETHPLFKGYTAPAKPVVFSKVMSYLDITGVFMPFTFEGNVNVDIPDYNIPATMLHELAHFKGFMRESDANFIAFQVGTESDNPDFAYSAYMLALVHTLNAYAVDAAPGEYAEMYSLLSPEVQYDLYTSREYWKKFETPVAEVSTKINDSYLKANRQESGVKSYGEMVDLLLAYHKNILES